jgi:hypothetical protein
MDKDCLDLKELPKEVFPQQIILTEDNKLFVSVREHFGLRMRTWFGEYKYK